MIDSAVFADTHWETPAVYQHLAWLESVAAKAGIKIHRVTRGSIRDDALVSQVRGVKSEGRRWASMPMFTKSPNGQVGRIKRQCTKEYKIELIERCIRREILGLKPHGHAKPGSVELWLGISWDERARMKSQSHVKWHSLHYPLITDINSPTSRALFPEGFSRNDCLKWLSNHGFPSPPRSACIGCPFHSDQEWLQIKSDPTLWSDVVAFDRMIRHSGGMRGQMYLHRSCVPLDCVEFNPKKNWDGMENECAGVCGV